MRISSDLNNWNFQEISKENGVGKDYKKSFGDFFMENLREVNRMQLESQDMSKKLITGEIDNLHDVSIMTEKANVALQATMGVRGKVIEAYKEIMRMQI